MIAIKSTLIKTTLKKTTATKYPVLLRCLHWVIAACIITMIALGWRMSELGYEATGYQVLYRWHGTIGLLLLPLGVAQLIAYSMLPRPALAANIQGWSRVLARFVHLFLLYAVVALPVAGYFMSGKYIVLIDGTSVPPIIDLSRTITKALFDIHVQLAWTVAAVVALHAAAALKHHFIDKDDTLRKIL